jgi:hypothetical protein
LLSFEHAEQGVPGSTATVSARDQGLYTPLNRKTFRRPLDSCAPHYLCLGGEPVEAARGCQRERVGDLRERIAGAVERSDDLLGSQTSGKLGGVIPGSFRLCGLWVPGGVGPGLRAR